MMVQIDDSATSLLGKAPGLLTLRVCGGSLNGQVVRLQASKCSVGSDPHCTLRLRAPGVNPLHCLILRGARGTVVRRFASGTRLNGATFVDAPLRAGDRLCLGPVELKVLDDGYSEQSNTRAEEFITGTKAVDATASIEPEVIERAQHNQAVEGLRTQTQQARRRSHRMLEELRSARRQIAELESLAAQSEARREQDTALRQVQERNRAIERTELACRVEELSRKLQQSTTEKLAFEQRLAVIQTELDAARQSDNEADDQTAERQAEHLRELRQRDAEVAELRTQLASVQEEWEARSAQEQQKAILEREQFDAKRDAWESERQEQSQRAESIEAELQQTTAQLQRLETERDAALAAALSTRTEVEQQQENTLKNESKKWEAQQSTNDALLKKTQEELHQQRERVASLENEVDRVTYQLERSTVERDAAIAELERSSTRAEQKHGEFLQGERREWDAERATLNELLEKAQTEIDSQRRSLEQQREQRQTEGSADQARLLEDLDALEEERAKFEQQRTEWAEKCQMDTVDVASSMQAALAEAEALNEDRRIFETECEQTRSQYEQQQLELEQQRRAWQEECQLWEENQTKQEQQLEQALQDLEANRVTLHRAQVELEAAQAQNAALPQTPAPEHDLPEESSSQGDNESAKDQESQWDDRYRQQEQVPHQGALDLDPDLDDASQADSATDVSESLQLDDHHDNDTADSLGASLWAEDTSSQEEAPIPQATADLEITFEPVTDESIQVTTTPPAEGEEEESIEDYMAKLLQRVQGQSSAPVIHETALGMQESPAATEDVTETVSTPESVEQETPSDEQEPLRKRVEPFVMQRRELPPELTSSLAAMRQLANSTARKAIDRSVQRRWLHAAIGKLVVSMTGLISGITLLSWATDYSGVTFLASLVAFLIAVFWGLQSAIIARNLLTTPRADDEARTPKDVRAADLLDKTVALVEEPMTKPSVAEDDFGSPENDSAEQAASDNESPGQALPDEEVEQDPASSSAGSTDDFPR